jgi:S-adenosyl-L-methionine hydrolase (adenosine-forming)
LHVTNLITLTTDFGLEDPFVGQVKGIILRRNINARIVDLTHAIEPHDILGGAITLRSSYHFFPAGSVHLVVVDPGVGSRRKILALRADGHIFIAPDNGTLTLVLRDRQVQALHLVTDSSLFLSKVGATFHGRDIMAPVAAVLAAGMPLDRVGPAISVDRCVLLDVPKPLRDENGITGLVLGADKFGNIRTSITVEDLGGFQHPFPGSVILGSIRIDAIVTTYSERTEGELLALIDSTGHLEIAVNRGNAAKQTGCRVGDPVRVVMP